MMKLAVGIPAYRSVISSNHALMWTQFGAEVARGGQAAELVMFAHVDVCGIERARNLLVAHAMKENADWLLMVDSDTWADDGKQLFKMIQHAPDCAMVGLPVRTRGAGGLNVYNWSGAESRHVQIDLAARILSRGVDRQAYEDVDAVGGAIIAIKLNQIGNADFRWHYREDGSSISEDLYFCRQLRTMGKKIYVYPQARTMHADRAGVLEYDPIKEA